MKEPDRAHLVMITNRAEMWIRKCGDNPRGYPTDRVSLRVVLAASKDVRSDTSGRITWSADGNQFTADPVLPEPPDLPA